jgi:hypothetical protein
LHRILGYGPAATNVLAGLTIGELGVVYEALLADQDHTSRKNSGQFFTPDDVAEFMAQHLSLFGTGHTWLDPCCGVGNLAWHLAAAHGEDARDLVADRLVLVDQDDVALKTAVAVLAISFLGPNDLDAAQHLAQRTQHRDFLSDEALPKYDFAILNPPYARSPERKEFATAKTRDLYAYFIERVNETASGFIAITPASFLSAPKYSPIRSILEERSGGDVYVFDNVPDTCFRGFKYGSNNTSKTNFVRAAITVCAPGMPSWRTTPILRWSYRSRKRLFNEAQRWLQDRLIGPDGVWAKLIPTTVPLWRKLDAANRSLASLTTENATEFRLEIASTPRYYISASLDRLDRASKHVLYFRSKADLEIAYMVLNSSLPYWWWRTVAGGISLARHTLLTMPIPDDFTIPNERLLNELRTSDRTDRTIKMNAGRSNENVKRPATLRNRVDLAVLGSAKPDFGALYASDMFQEEAS